MRAGSSTTSNISPKVQQKSCSTIQSTWKESKETSRLKLPFNIPTTSIVIFCWRLRTTFTYEGGNLNESGFKDCRTRVINDYARKAGILKENDDNLSGEDVREAPDGRCFDQAPGSAVWRSNQTKLGNSDARAVTDTRCFLKRSANSCWKILQSQKRIVEKGERYAEGSRGCQKSARSHAQKERTWNFQPSGQACRQHEQRSGNFRIVHRRRGFCRRFRKQGRSRLTRSLFCRFEARSNVEKASLDRILANEEIRSLFTALGTGFGQDFNVEKSITTNWSSWPMPMSFCQLSPSERCFWPCSIVSWNRWSKRATSTSLSRRFTRCQGKMIRYIDSTEELKEVLEACSRARNRSFSATKVLAKWMLNSFGNTMDPEKRRLLRTPRSDAEEANSVFEMLMGDQVDQDVSSLKMMKCHVCQ